MRSAALTGIGAHRPALRRDNADIAARIDSTDAWIRERSGIVTRGVAGADESVVDMAVSAGGKALAAAGVDPADVGLVLVATCTLTHAVPGAAARVATGLGLTSAGALDLGAACAGFTYGLALAADTVRCGSADNVLVIGAEKFSDIINPLDRSTSFLFGDGAGAGVVGVSDVDGISKPVWSSDGAQADVLRTVGSPPLLEMEGKAVYRWATTMLPSFARATCERAGIALDELAAVVPHQANLRITESMVRALKLPAHVVVARDVIDSGNTSAASIPLALDRLLATGEVHRGDQVLLLGFGAGLTAAGQVVRCP
ncbi:MAG: 3-oxoacyl-[acyl-carrier-protein] synthase [Actinomycetota bacterium]|nr:3-oxoacyl-[acyl-carrier-protein] synthase [Actinomycetota bacterium]